MQETVLQSEVQPWLQAGRVRLQEVRVQGPVRRRAMRQEQEVHQGKMRLVKSPQRKLFTRVDSVKKLHVPVRTLFMGTYMHN